MDNKHCNQSETLDFVPTSIPALKAKKKVRGKNNNDKLIFEFEDNIDQYSNLIPILSVSSFVGIGMNSQCWLLIFL